MSFYDCLRCRPLILWEEQWNIVIWNETAHWNHTTSFGFPFRLNLVELWNTITLLVSPCNSIHPPHHLLKSGWLNEENTITLIFVKKVSCHPGRDSSMLVCLESGIIDHVEVHLLCYSWQPPAKCISCWPIWKKMASTVKKNSNLVGVPSPSVPKLLNKSLSAWRWMQQFSLK